MFGDAKPPQPSIQRTSTIGTNRARAAAPEYTMIKRLSRFLTS
jgi:hypothetical protein